MSCLVVSITSFLIVEFFTYNTYSIQLFLFLWYESSTCMLNIISNINCFKAFLPMIVHVGEIFYLSYFIFCFCPIHISHQTSFNHAAKHGDVRGKSKPRTKLPPMPNIRTGSNLPSRDKRSPSFHWIRPELTNRWNNISLRYDSSSARSLVPSRTSRGLGTWDRSGTIPHFSEQKNIAPIMIARNTWPSNTGPSVSTWKSLSKKVFSKSTFSLPKQLPDPDCSMLHRVPSHNIWSPNTSN